MSDSLGHARTAPRRRSGAARLVLVVVAAVAVAALSLVASDFWLQTGLFAMAAVVSAVGLSLLVGVAGQLSLAHAFFIGVGAYSYALLAGPADDPHLIGLGLPPVLAAVLAVLLSGLAGALFSPISGRLRGIYLGLASLGLVFIGQHVLINAASLTGGFNGRDSEAMSVLGFMFGAEHPTGLYVLGQSFGRLERLWVLFLVVAVAACWLARNLVEGRVGRAWGTVRHGELAAGVLGIDVQRAKASAFTVSSMYAGLGGVLIALAFGRIVPESFGLALSINMLVMIVIGGIGTVGGAAIGAVFVTAVPLVFDRYSGALPFVADPGQPGMTAGVAARLLYGVAIVIVLLFARDGVAGLWQRRGPAAKANDPRNDPRNDPSNNPSNNPSNDPEPDESSNDGSTAVRTAVANNR